MSLESLPYRPNVCMLVINTDRKLLLGERHGAPGVFQFPQGGVEEGFSLEENVYRELEEELGLVRSKVQIIKQLAATHKYDFANPPHYAIGRWRGQAQTFWLIQFLGVDADINLNFHTPEFESFLWCEPAEVRKVAEPRRRAGYEAALKEVEELIRNGLR